MRSCILVLLTAAPLVFSFGSLATGCDTVLLVIDMQKLWVEEEGWLTINLLDVVTAVAVAITSAREGGLPTVFVKDISSDYASADQLGFPEVIEPQTGETVVSKTKSSAFDETGLKQILDTQGITRLLVCGISSGACVSSTVNAARELGYEIVIVADAHSGGANGKIAAFRNRMWASWGISVIPTAEIDFAAFCVSEDSAPQ